MAFTYTEDDDDTPIVPRVRKPRPIAASDEVGEDEEEDIRPTRKVVGGWAAAQAQAQADSPYAQNLRLSQDQVLIKFLEDEPFANFRRHWVDRKPYNCLGVVGVDCPLCNIGHRASPTSAFNVAKMNDDGSLTLNAWDVSPKYVNVLKSFGTDPKTGPLSKHFFYVSKVGVGTSSQTNIVPVRASTLLEDGIPIPAPEELASIGKYDATIIKFPKKRDLEEVAAGLSEV